MPNKETINAVYEFLCRLYGFDDFSVRGTTSDGFTEFAVVVDDNVDEFMDESRVYTYVYVDEIDDCTLSIIFDKFTEDKRLREEARARNLEEEDAKLFVRNTEILFDYVERYAANDTRNLLRLLERVRELEYELRDKIRTSLELEFPNHIWRDIYVDNVADTTESFQVQARGHQKNGFAGVYAQWFIPFNATNDVKSLSDALRHNGKYHTWKHDTRR